MSDNRKRKELELLEDLAKQTSRILQEVLAIDSEAGNHVGQEVANYMAINWGGQNVYIPKGVSIMVSKRHLEIYADFNGHNHAELSRKYGFSMPWIYRVVKLVRAEEVARRQGRLFPEEPTNAA